MTRRLPDHPEMGFTLPELLVAITILGIIMVAIGAMITTSFRTSTTVSAELQGSRGPKVVSRYWAPDVEGAETVTPGSGCGGAGAVATMVSHDVTSAFATPGDAGLGATRTIEWCVVTNGRRDQLIRRDTRSGTTDARVVVADLIGTPSVVVDGPRATITVAVPDRGRTDDTYTFDVAATSQVTTTTSAP